MDIFEKRPWKNSPLLRGVVLRVGDEPPHKPGWTVVHETTFDGEFDLMTKETRALIDQAAPHGGVYFYRTDDGKHWFDGTPGRVRHHVAIVASPAYMERKNNGS